MSDLFRAILLFSVLYWLFDGKPDIYDLSKQYVTDKLIEEVKENG